MGYVTMQRMRSIQSIFGLGKNDGKSFGLEFATFATVYTETGIVEFMYRLGSIVKLIPLRQLLVLSKSHNLSLLLVNCRTLLF
jgi:hypothetical protein